MRKEVGIEIKYGTIIAPNIPGAGAPNKPPVAGAGVEPNSPPEVAGAEVVDPNNPPVAGAGVDPNKPVVAGAE